MKPVNEMDEQACRDEIAKAKGYTTHQCEAETMDRGVGYVTKWRHDSIGSGLDHPILATLDAAHNSLPEGYEWEEILHWIGSYHEATASKTDGHAVTETGNSMRLAMLRASTAAHRAEKENANG